MDECCFTSSSQFNISVLLFDHPTGSVVVLHYSLGGFFFNVFILAELDLHFFVWAFASCSEWGLLCCGVKSSHCGGFSCFGAQARELRLQ